MTNELETVTADQLETMSCNRLQELMDDAEAVETEAARALAWWVSCGYGIESGRGAAIVDSYRSAKRRRFILTRELSRRNSTGNYIDEQEVGIWTQASSVEQRAT